MSPRPKKVSDQEVYAAAYRVMNRVGAGDLTLGAIAAEAGLTAGALVQRFGSKHGLLVELYAGLPTWTAERFARLRAQHASPLAALRAYAGSFGQMAEGPGGLAHHLGYLQLDLTDPALHRHVKAQAQAARRGIRRLLDAAVTTGELRPTTDTATLARTVEAIVGGSLFAWAFYREGAASGWVRREVDAVLRPYRTARGRRPPTVRSASGSP